jgi:D-alanyl-D-alanine carboxypeptidase/D-alanyl-D-alanine-endopeptidase (penicillin-binding protein 4)
VRIIKDFWKKNGIDAGAMNIVDGSGLSPANRVTAKAFVSVLKYAQTKPWFSSFLHAMPLYNNIKMKRGTIGGVRSYCGYLTSKSGKEYTFSITVNNYIGSLESVNNKVYKVLDLLK